MRWEGNRESSNVEDRRGEGGGVGGFGFGGRSIGIGTVVVALLGGWLFGINPLTMLGLLSGGGVQQTQAPAHAPPANDKQAQFVETVLASTEDVWSQQLPAQAQGSYQPPKLVLYRGATRTACGTGQAAMGPFYCPNDQKVYLDMDFFDELSAKLNSPGEFARAYVIAHEVGHHVQNLLGISSQAERTGNSKGAGGVSVRVELQADCFAGIWAHAAEQQHHWLDPGDVESALNAASQIGDDTLQRRSRGAVVPDTFTHGTSAQRVTWFRRGFESGSLQQCDTFGSREL